MDLNLKLMRKSLFLLTILALNDKDFLHDMYKEVVLSFIFLLFGVNFFFIIIILFFQMKVVFIFFTYLLFLINSEHAFSFGHSIEQTMYQLS